MTLGVVMLCHADLDRAAQLAQFWAKDGTPVVLHIDRQVRRADHDRLATALADLPQVSLVARRHRGAWGTWGLVRAAQDGAQQILARHPEVRHVFLASGSCLPLRPVAHLRAYLDAHPDTDFIESVTAAEVTWAAGGLNLERFLRRFPFAWKQHPRLFEGYLKLQRRLGLRRRIPQGVTPHLGSQWWCLTRRTLTAILTDPDRPRFDRYFRRVWIPDESYFQSLVRRHSTRIESRSLTLSTFDAKGRPHLFYDDHLELLRDSNCFVARKVWAGAERLFSTFLAPQPDCPEMTEPDPAPLRRQFARAAERGTRGRVGLRSQGRLPHPETGKTAGPYTVLHGFADLFEGFEPWLARETGACVHGHLFAPEHVQFADKTKGFAGGLSDNAALRDYDPQGFLTSLLWNARDRRQCFSHGPRDSRDCDWFMATDPNAHILAISGAWVVPLFRSGKSAAAVRTEAARLHRIEADQMNILRSIHAKARIRIWTLAEVAETPSAALMAAVEETCRTRHAPADPPQIVDLTGLGGFLQDLRNQGMQPTLTGDFPIRPARHPLQETLTDARL